MRVDGERLSMTELNLKTVTVFSLIVIIVETGLPASKRLARQDFRTYVIYLVWWTTLSLPVVVTRPTLATQSSNTISQQTFRHNNRDQKQEPYNPYK